MVQIIIWSAITKSTSRNVAFFASFRKAHLTTATKNTSDPIPPIDPAIKCKADQIGSEPIGHESQIKVGPIKTRSGSLVRGHLKANKKERTGKKMAPITSVSATRMFWYRIPNIIVKMSTLP